MLTIFALILAAWAFYILIGDTALYTSRGVPLIVGLLVWSMVVILLIPGCAALPQDHYDWSAPSDPPCPGLITEHWTVGDISYCDNGDEACLVRFKGHGTVEKCEVIAAHDLLTSRGLETRDFGVSVFEHEARHWRGENHR